MPTLEAQPPTEPTGETPLNPGKELKPKRYPLFDYMRIGFALEVVREHYFHARPLFGAVAAFLALSGFLVLQSYENSQGWLHFAWKRLLRVVPAFCAGLVLVGLYAGGSAIVGVVRAYLTLGIATSPHNNAVWSLGWEELYYLLLAVLFTVGAYRRKWPIWCLLVTGMVASYFFLGELAPRILWAARPLAGSFFAGNLCYLYRSELPRFKWVALVAAPVLCLISPMFPLPFILAPLFGACMITIGYSFTPKVWKITDVSYGVYMYHLPCLGIMVALGVSHAAWRALPLTLAIAYFSAILIEQPALKYKNRLLRLHFSKPRGPEPLAVEAA